MLLLATSAFLVWTGTGALTALVLLLIFLGLLFRTPQNMTEKWTISAPLWVLTLGLIVAAILFLRPTDMPSVQSYLIHVGLRVAINPDRPPDDFQALRQTATVAVSRTPRLMAGVERQVVDTADVKGEWLLQAGRSPTGPVILWMHGGSYVSGHPATTRPIAMDMVLKTGAALFSVQYRLAPEHPYPAALDDVKAAYAWLLQSGFRPGSIVVGGESSGAGLALALALSLKEQAQPMPAGLVAISPWVDLANTAESLTSRADRDAMLTPAFMAAAAKAYAGDDVRGPSISPLYADLSGLPPLIIQDGDESILVDDSRRLYERAKAQGVNVTLRVWPGAPHIVTSLFMFLPEGRRSLDDVEAFIRSRLGLATP